MRIICDYCLTEYEVHPPPNTSGESRFSFRCSNCGRVFSAERTEQEATAAESVEAPEPAPEEQPTNTPSELGNDILVRQGDQTYSAGDQATVQRWIVERRLNREGFICLDGETWTPLGSVESLQPFLGVVEQLQSFETPAQALSEPDHEETPAIPVQRSAFAEVAELESLVDVEPPDTQDELDVDPFPTEEVPLPAAPITANLAGIESAPEFEPPNTEEVDFDYPVNDDATLDSELIELPDEPELPSLAHAKPMIEVEAPSFDDAPEPFSSSTPEDLAPPEATETPEFAREQILADFPTEDELTLSEDEDSDPLGNQVFASLDSDWDDEDDDLAWVNDRKRGRRIATGLLLGLLVLLTVKLFMDRSSEEGSSDAALTDIEIGAADAQAIEVEEGDADPTEAPPIDAGTDAEPSTVDAGTDAEPSTVDAEPPPAPKRRATPPPAAPAEPTPNQAQLSQTARAAQTRRGPQPTTAADFVDRGRQAISEGNYNAARLYYLDAVDMEPSNAAANQGLAFAALQQGDTPFAIRHFCITLSLTSPTSSMAQETQRALNDLNSECP